MKIWTTKWATKWATKITKQLASIRLAVVVIVAFAALSSIGTFVEARYDATAASKLVYRTWWMYSLMGLLALNLTAVMVDRWPWQRRHAPFVLAHIGILVLLAGSLLTSQFGLDGTMRVGLQDKNRFVTLPSTDLVVWSSFDGTGYTRLWDSDVDFFVDRPKEHPLEIPLDGKTLRIIDYAPYALASPKVVPASSETAGAGLRFELKNDRVQIAEWMVQKRQNEMARQNLGPAEVVLGELPKEIPKDRNVIFVEPAGSDSVRYLLVSRDATKAPLRGKLAESEVLKTPWMGLEFRLQRFIPKAEQIWEFQFLDRPTPLTNAAILVEYDGKQQWVQQNDVVKYFGDNIVYILSWGNRRIDIGFDIFLKDFKVGHYPGTMRAASYSSQVEVPQLGEFEISMNEPLKHKGLTIYQASFQEGPDGAPVASIFSINRDPGRWVKYLGSLIISLGIVMLFVNRRASSRRQAPATPEDIFGKN